VRERPSGLARTTARVTVGNPNDTLAFETKAFHLPKEEE
jgi:hypothetical protein